MVALSRKRIVMQEFVAWAGIDPDQTILAGAVLGCKLTVGFSAGRQFFEFAYRGTRCVIDDHRLTAATRQIAD